MDEQKGTREKIYVLDSSAFLSGAELSGLRGFVVPSVREEIVHGVERQRLEVLLEGNLREIIPDAIHLEYVGKAARETGDDGRLSATDLEVIAAARMLIEEMSGVEVVILSDDYSVQNLANHLGIGFESFSTDGIRRKWRWGLRCRGCGRYYEEGKKGSECHVCGHTLKKVRIG